MTHRFTTEELVTFFQFLDDLKFSGITNMLESGRYLEVEYELGREAAIEVQTLWTKTYDKWETAEMRVMAAQKQPPSA